MNDPIDDKTLDDYLSGGSQISRRYRELDDVAVPSQLDQQVLTRARDAVADRQPESTDELERLRQRRKRLMQWSVPAGLAASAVLVIAIVMQSGVQHEVLSVPQTPASAPAAVEERSERSADKEEGLMAPIQPDTNEMFSVRPAPPPAPVSQISPADTAADDARRRTETEKAETNASRLRQQPPESSIGVTSSAHDQAKQSASPPSIKVPPPKPMAENAPSGATSHPPQEVQQSTSARAISSSAIEQKTATQQAAQSRDSGLQGSAAESRRAASQADYDLSEVAVTGSRAYRPVAGSGPRDTVPRRASAESPDPAVSEPQVPEEPDKWLERIRQLRKDGRTQDADGEWKRFREAYPDYDVAGTDIARGRR